MSTHILLDKYELIERVGVGGMAEVYKVRLRSPKNLSKIVALKRILPYHCADKGFVHMFLDEARIALSLNHPNIGQIYELGQIEDTWFLIMEFIDGPNLSMLIKQLRKTRHRIPPALALSIATQICRGLYAAHTQHDEHGQPMQIIHRDVSPHNVMVSSDGSVKLIDFGIAKARHRLVQTSTGTVRGKLLYMSPEQAASKPLTQQTDIFSAGMLLVTLLNGQHMWRGSDEVEVLMALRKWSVPRVDSMCPEMSPEHRAQLQAILERAMAFDPEDRYPDAEAMRRDLAILLASLDPGLSPLRLGRFVLDVMESRLEDALPPLGEPTEEASYFNAKTEQRQLEPQKTENNTFMGLETRRMSREMVHEAVRQHQEGAAGSALEHTADINTRGLSPEHTHTGLHTDSRLLEDGLLGPDTSLPPMEAAHTVRSSLPTLKTPATDADERPTGGKVWALSAPLLAIGALLMLCVGLMAGVILWQALDQGPEPTTVELGQAQVPSTGALQVDSRPAGAAILIDGQVQEQPTPARIKDLGPGEHVLTLEVEGKEVHRQAFTMAPGADLTFFADLRQQAEGPGALAAASPDAGADQGEPDAAPDQGDKKGKVDEMWITEDDTEFQPDKRDATLVLRSTPAASVMIDGELLPDKASDELPLEVTPLQQGRTYKIKVQRRGYDPQEISLKLDQPRVEQSFRLKRRQEFGYLTLTSTPWAEVFIDNRRVASSTPLRKHRLPAGPHTVLLKNPAQKLQKSLRVEIKPNETLQRRIRL